MPRIMCEYSLTYFTRLSHIIILSLFSLSLTSSSSAGHQVEDRTMYTEGEPETSTTQAGDAVAAATAVATETLVPASAPDVASKTPSAAPPKVTEDEESKEEKEKPQEEEETKEAEDTLLSKVATKDSIQGAVDKVQASKAGHVSNLDAGSPDETGMHGI